MSSSSLTRRLLNGGTAIASAGVLAFSGVGWWATNHFDGEITRTTVFASVASGAAGVGTAGRPAVDPRAGDSMNILVVGSDNRDGLSQRQRSSLHLGSLDYGNHTDTMMLVHIGKNTEHVSVIGFPRDSVVTIPECTDATGKKRGEVRTRINEAFSRGGGSCLIATIEKATDIKIDHYVEVSFTAFLGMVDAVDGVDVCLAKPLKDNPKYTSLDLPAGRSTLDGAMALDFVRARHIDSDFGRIDRQQQFLAALLQKASSAGTLTNPVALNNLVSAALTNTKVDETLDRDAILALAGRMAGIKFSQIEFPKIPIADAAYTEPTTGATWLVKWDDAGARTLFESIRSDTQITARVDPAATPSPAPTATVSTSQIRVAVLNGTTIKGLGGTVSTALADLGYRITSSAKTAKQTDYASTLIRFDPRYAESVKTVTATFPGSTTKAVEGLGRTIQVIVGADYTGVTPPAVRGAAKPAPTTSGIEASVASDTICTS